VGLGGSRWGVARGAARGRIVFSPGMGHTIRHGKVLGSHEQRYSSEEFVCFFPFFSSTAGVY
jgi:hypothetical protein